MEDEFDLLAAKALAGEATRDEHARLESLLEASEERRAEYARVRSTWQALRAAGPAVFSRDVTSAKIPGARLRHLQRVVREKRQESVTTVSAPAQSPKPDARNLSGLQVLRLWISSSNGLARVAAVLCLAAAVAALAIFNFPERGPSAGVTDDRLIGHLLMVQGTSEIARAGKRLPVASAAALRNGDRVYLSEGVVASLVTPAGEVSLRGPLQSSADELTTSVRPLQQGTPTSASLATTKAILFDPLTNLSRSNWVATTRSAGTIPVYSPAVATGSQTPLILWKSEPGKTYDVRIQDEFDAATPAWFLTNVSPPVAFTEIPEWQSRPLALDGLYRLRVGESGRPLTVSETTFRTVKDDVTSGTNPRTPPLQRALQIQLNSPARVGDVLAILHSLPAAQAGSELALRLKLAAFVQLSLQSECEAALDALRDLP